MKHLIPPFDKETRSTSELKQIKMKLPPLKKSAPWLSKETCNVIDKAMAFDAEDRYGSYQEMIDALQMAELALEEEGDFIIDKMRNFLRNKVK